MQVEPHSINAMQERIAEVRDHFFSIKDRTERLAFLTKYLSKHESSKGGQVPLMNSVGVVNSSSTGSGPVIYGMMRDYVRFVEPVIMKDDAAAAAGVVVSSGGEVPEKGIFKKTMIPSGASSSNRDQGMRANPKAIRKTAQMS